QTLEQSLSDLVANGKVTYDEAMIKAPDKEAFQKFLRERGVGDGSGSAQGAGANGRPNPNQGNPGLGNPGQGQPTFGNSTFGNGSSSLGDPLSGGMEPVARSIFGLGRK